MHIFAMRNHITMKQILFVLTSILVASCGGGAHDAPSDDDDRQQNILAEDIPNVEVACAKEQSFYHEIMSNGKISADRYADVYWNVEGTIAKINVLNGKQVSKNEAIATLDATKLQNSLQSASAALEQSRLAMQDVIIGQGYNPQSDTIPESVIKLAQVKSGYLQSLANYNSTKYDYESSTLRSPIAGVVANLSDRENNPANRSKPFCRIIDPNSLCIEFSILESEIPLIKIGEKADITVFSMPQKTWTGQISEINPYVESSGMIKVKAKILHCAGLYEGMNISLKIRKDMGKMLAVPKGAVVFRSGRAVVFTAKNGHAQWNYVETSTENSEMIAIKSGISEGDSVIYSGNTFLADRTVINVKQ